MKSTAALIGLILALSSTVSHATPTSTTVGVGATTGTLDCAKTTNSACIWQFPIDSTYADVGSSSHTINSGTSSVSDIRGSSSASGHGSDSSYLPTLHAYASSNGDYAPTFPALSGLPAPLSGGNSYTGMGSGVADANVWAVQGYKYNGLTSFNLTVTGTLDSIFSASGLPQGFGGIGHSQFILSIFDATGYVFDPDDLNMGFSKSNCPIFVGPNTRSPCVDMPTVFSHGIATLYNSGSISQTVAHIVNPGDKFFVSAFLDASVCCGQTVDSSHTLNLAFNDFSQLSSIPVPGVVPEPDSLLLFITIFGLVCGVVRLRNRTSTSKMNAGPASANQ